jgi:hypothetical protein
MKKRCSLCKEEKDLSEFGKRDRYKDGRSYRCKRCESEKSKQQREKLKSVADSRIKNDGEKVCAKCGETKSLIEFRIHILCVDGRAQTCIECTTRRKNAQRKTPEAREKIRKYVSEYRKERPEVHLLYEAKKRAKSKDFECLLSLSDIKIPDLCPVLGIPLFIKGGRPTDNSPTIDRINNSLGYTPDNVAVVSYRANSIKRDATLDELKRIVAFLEEHQVQNG